MNGSFCDIQIDILVGINRAEPLFDSDQTDGGHPLGLPITRALCTGSFVALRLCFLVQMQDLFPTYQPLPPIPCPAESVFNQTAGQINRDPLFTYDAEWYGWALLLRGH